MRVSKPRQYVQQSEVINFLPNISKRANNAIIFGETAVQKVGQPTADVIKQKKTVCHHYSG